MITFLKKMFGLNKSDEAASTHMPAPALVDVVVPQPEPPKPVRHEPPLAESAPVPISVESSPPAVEEKPTPAVITPKSRAKKPAKAAAPKVDNTVVMPKRPRTKKTADGTQQDGIPIVETSGTWPFPPPEEGAAKTATKTKKSKK